LYDKKNKNSVIEIDRMLKVIWKVFDDPQSYDLLAPFGITP